MSTTDVMAVGGATVATGTLVPVADVLDRETPPARSAQAASEQPLSADPSCSGVSSADDRRGSAIEHSGVDPSVPSPTVASGEGSRGAGSPKPLPPIRARQSPPAEDSIAPNVPEGVDTASFSTPKGLPDPASLGTIVLSKRLQASDVKSGRVVLPRAMVEKHFSDIGSLGTLRLSVFDPDTNAVVPAVVKTWANGTHKRMYALEQVGGWLRARRMRLGDVLSIERLSDGSLRFATQPPQAEGGADAGAGADGPAAQPSSRAANAAAAGAPTSRRGADAPGAALGPRARGAAAPAARAESPRQARLPPARGRVESVRGAVEAGAAGATWLAAPATTAAAAPAAPPAAAPVVPAGQAGADAAGLTVLVAKCLTNSDAGSGRVILPRVAVETRLPHVAAHRHCAVRVLDEDGRPHDFVIKSWANGSEHRRVFVLEQAAEYLRTRRLGVGDVLGLCCDAAGDLHVRANTPAARAAAQAAARGGSAGARARAGARAAPALHAEALAAAHAGQPAPARAAASYAVAPAAATYAFQAGGRQVPARGFAPTLTCCPRAPRCAKSNGHAGFCSGPRDGVWGPAAWDASARAGRPGSPPEAPFTPLASDGGQSPGTRRGSADVDATATTAPAELGNPGLLLCPAARAALPQLPCPLAALDERGRLDVALSAYDVRARRVVLPPSQVAAAVRNAGEVSDLALAAVDGGLRWRFLRLRAWRALSGDLGWALEGGEVAALLGDAAEGDRLVVRRDPALGHAPRVEVLCGLTGADRSAAARLPGALSITALGDLFRPSGGAHPNPQPLAFPGVPTLSWARMPATLLTRRPWERSDLEVADPAPGDDDAEGDDDEGGDDARTDLAARAGASLALAAFRSPYEGAESSPASSRGGDSPPADGAPATRASLRRRRGSGPADAAPLDGWRAGKRARPPPAPAPSGGSAPVPLTPTASCEDPLLCLLDAVDSFAA